MCRCWRRHSFSARPAFAAEPPAGKVSGPNPKPTTRASNSDDAAVQLPPRTRPCQKRAAMPKPSPTTRRPLSVIRNMSRRITSARTNTSGRASTPRPSPTALKPSQYSPRLGDAYYLRGVAYALAQRPREAQYRPARGGRTEARAGGERQQRRAARFKLSAPSAQCSERPGDGPATGGRRVRLSRGSSPRGSPNWSAAGGFLAPRQKAPARHGKIQSGERPPKTQLRAA